MLRRLYDWTINLAGKPYALWALLGVAFIEASVFPIPPDVLMIPMILVARQRAFRIAALATMASVAGGVLGYAIGAGLYETVGAPIIAYYHADEAFASFAARYETWGVWAVMIAGVTPFPFKVVTIASGFVDMSFVPFVVVSVAARALRFFIVAYLLWRFGAPIKAFIERRLGLLFTLFIALLIGGFIVVGLL